jgi:hypothetical protein
MPVPYYKCSSKGKTGGYRQKKDRPRSANGVDNILMIHSEWFSCQNNPQMNRL